MGCILGEVLRALPAGKRPWGRPRTQEGLWLLAWKRMDRWMNAWKDGWENLHARVEGLVYGLLWMNIESPSTSVLSDRCD